MKTDPYIGCLLGTAVGDSLGLPYEGINPQRADRMFPDRGEYHFLFGKGMVSDDTEHACFVTQALIRAKDDAERFQRLLARSLRWWLLGVPAGTGLATLRSILKLWIGISPSKSGVFSAGNGPAMRSPVLGVVFGDNETLLKEFVRKSTEITHSDPKAFYGAIAVALAASYSSGKTTFSGEDFLKHLQQLLQDENADEFIDLVLRAVQSADKNESVSTFAISIGSPKGISGYIYHTVPCVIQVWLRYTNDFENGLKEIIAAGGDTDTTAAILGAIIGAGVGKSGIPDVWLNSIIEWPRSIEWMEKLGEALATSIDGEKTECPGYFFPGMILRNIFFLVIVLCHGFRRLAPPY